MIKSLTSSSEIRAIPLLIIIVSVSIIVVLFLQILSLQKRQVKLKELITKIEEGRQLKVFYHTHHRLPTKLEETHEKEKIKNIPEKEDRIKMILGKK